MNGVTVGVVPNLQKVDCCYHWNLVVVVLYFVVAMATIAAPYGIVA